MLSVHLPRPWKKVRNQIDVTRDPLQHGTPIALILESTDYRINNRMNEMSQCRAT